MNKSLKFLQKNGFPVLMGIVIMIMLVSPDAKSWTLRQLMRTGFFNAKIEKIDANVSTGTSIHFDFADGKDNVQNTASLKGKVVFINFWASWCPPCRAEFPSIEKLYLKYKDNPDFFFLGINKDNNLSAGKEYLRRESYSIPIFKSAANIPAEIYTGTLPTTIVLDKNGKIRLRHEGFANYSSKKFLKQIEELINE